MQLWPGPGPDRELLGLWGEELQRSLDTEVRQLEGQRLPLGGVCRVHPGRLHCDFLAWVATREPEPGATQASAPSRELLVRALVEVFAFCAERNVERIALAALGSGPGELPRADRLVLAAEAAHAYHARCIEEGKAPVVEHVILCEALSDVHREATRRIGKLAKSSEPERRAPADAKAKPKAARTRKASGPRVKGLDPDDVARARSMAAAYSMRRTYIVGDWLVHPKFGVGRVEATNAEGAADVLFEDRATRKMVHGRA
jgi:hypothetical protein